MRMTPVAIANRQRRRSREASRTFNSCEWVMHNRGLPSLVIPREMVETGHVAAYACRRLGVIDPDDPHCPNCGANNQFYNEHCHECRAPKPWLYPNELPPGRARARVLTEIFDDLR